MRLVPETDSLPRLLVFPYLAVVALIAVLFVFWGRTIEQLAFCPLRRMTGIPCPTCGGTHAALALVKLDFAAALAWNPLLTGVMLAFAGWVAYAVLATLMPKWRRQLQFTTREVLLLRCLAGGLLLGGWVYQILLRR
ncbi:MAG: DUF2752 domain-containing protein [bacterium]